MNSNSPATVPDPAHCGSCGKPRQLRNGSTVCREGSHGLCGSCTRREHEATTPDPYQGKRWYEREPAPEVRAEPVPLTSGDEGYRPSRGTARTEQAA